MRAITRRSERLARQLRRDELGAAYDVAPSGTTLLSMMVPTGGRRLSPTAAAEPQHLTGRYSAAERATPPSPGEAINDDTLAGSKPSTSRRISSVCSPSNGERFTSDTLSDILIGLPTLRYLPRVG